MPEPTTLTTVGIWAAVIGVIGVFLKLVGPWRKQVSDIEEKLRKELSDLLTIERREHAAERVALAKRVLTLERFIEKQQAVHSAERALDRHRINNLQSCFDAMMLMLKATPEKTSEIVAHVEALRAEQLKSEALEKAAIHAAIIQQIDEEMP